MIHIDTPKAFSKTDTVKHFHVISDLVGREMHEELQEFLGSIGIPSDHAIWHPRSWNEHGRAPEAKFNEALKAGATHATSEDVARLFYAKKDDGQGKSKKKPIKKEIENGTDTHTDTGSSDSGAGASQD